MGSKGPNAHLTFAYLCRFLESSSQPSRRKGDKIIAFQTYLRKFEDPYTLLRLMCPGIDYARANYGLKENELAKLFSNVLALPDTQKERLVQYKNASKQSGHECVAGDFMSVLYSVLEHRVGTKPSNLTLDEVDRCLDDLTKGDQRSPMLEMVRVMSSLELKWLARIILKDMKLGFDHKSVIRSLHRDALELFNASSDLKQVLDEIKKLGTSAVMKEEATPCQPDDPAPASEPEAAQKSSENPQTKDALSEPASTPTAAPQDLLFQKLKPMLARRLPSNRERMLEGRTFLVETKLDGERMIAHICRDTNTVKLFTRNCIEYTSQYSQILDPIKKALRGKQAILDGEIVAYSSLDNKILPFGNNRAVAATKDEGSVILVYYIFDVLYYKSDGEAKNLCGTALELRKNFLRQIIVDSKTVKVVAHEGPFSEISKMESLLLRAIDNKEEGIMIKDVKSIYRFHRRNAGWFKMKPEHSGLVEHLDLLVFGAYFADTSKRRNSGSDHVADQCSIFLVGALDPDTGAVVGVARVGTGYDIAQLADIRNMLRPHLRKYDPEKRPAWCQYKFSTKNTPDAMIDDPKHGFIMEVRASEIIDSVDFEFEHTLRFPTAHIPIRRDKDWNEAMTVEQLRELTTESRQLAQKAKRERIQETGASGGESGTDQEMPLAKRHRGPATSSGANRVIARFKPTDTSLVKSDSALFAAKEIFVLNGDEKYCIQEIEKFIVTHGGVCVKNRRPTTDFVVAAKMDLRAKNTARLQVDILRYQYLFDCEDAKEIIAMKPWHMLATSDKTRREVLADYDRFGDHYRDPISTQMFLTIAPPQNELQGVSDHYVELARSLVTAKMGLRATHTARCEDAKGRDGVMEDAKEIRKKDATIDPPVLETEDAKEIIPVKPEEVFEDTTRREDMCGDYDRFGDHYRDPISTQMFLTISPSQDHLQGVSDHLVELARSLY